MDSITVSVVQQANNHACDWQDHDDNMWLSGLVEEVGELAMSLRGKHEHSPDHELQQIASIAINWLRLRAHREES